MGQFFRISRSRHALSITADSITIDVPAGRKLKLHGLRASGGDSTGVASAEVGAYRTTANGSGGTPTSLSVTPLDPNVSVPSGFTAKFGYTTQPTLASGDPPASCVFQPYGGEGVWPAVPGAPAEYWAATAYQVAVRGMDTSGTDAPNCSLDLLVELE